MHLADNYMQYKRVILKFSGEVLKISDQKGVIDYKIVKKLCETISNLHKNGIEIGVVLGGGNIFRGLQATQLDKYDRVTGDYMGMLATVINCLAVKDCLDKLNIPVTLYSSLNMPDVCEKYTIREALDGLAKGKVLLLAGGTGSAFFSTDSAAALRASELHADVVLKATRVDGIYDKDPEKYPEAKKFDRISFADVINKHLNVMDATAFTLCMDNDIPILVIKVLKNDMSNIELALTHEGVGSLVCNF